MKDEPISARRACPSCGSRSLYTRNTAANGGHGPTLLPKLGAFLAPAQFDLILCGQCGHLSLFATEETLSRLPSKKGEWKQVW